MLLFANKKLGQNFLVAKDVAKRIVDYVDPKGKTVLEIGPGPGILTRFLVEKNPKRLILCEVDRFYYNLLRKEFEDYKNVEVLNEDILNLKDVYVDVCVGNLPFNISTQILFKSLEFKPQYCVFMFQKEVGEKIIAKPGTRSYGRISLVSQFYFDIEYLMTVPKRFFKPKPKVDACVLKLVRKRDRNLEFEEFVRKIFRYRNKNLSKVLKNEFGIEYESDRKIKDLDWKECYDLFLHFYKRKDI
jgi:16S rRNA (adenine1518-N6/adenine1519-N6)-dimethyltransferase